MPDPVTLQMVAEAANVSVSTASRALRGHAAISEESTVPTTWRIMDMTMLPLLAPSQIMC